MKKIFSLLGGLAIIVLSTISCTFAYTQEQQEAYQWAYRYRITTQPTIKDANLGGNITRQELSKMIVNYLENLAGVNGKASNLCSFTDENKANNELRSYAKKACAYKIMGSNGSDFRPRDKVTRAELGTVLSRILWGDEYNNSGKKYYIYHLNALKYNGIMNNIDNPTSSYAKRGDVMIMLKRIYEKYGSNISMNGGQDSAYNDITASNNTTNNTVNNTNNTSNNNEKYLTQEEVRKLIEKEEGLKENSLYSNGYECLGESCTYRFEYSIDGKEYIYHRGNTASDKTEKIQNLGINNAIDVALKDANVSSNEAKVKESYGNDIYIIRIISKDNVFVYGITLDGKIKSKKILITEEKALNTILKEVNLEGAKSDIKNENEEICSLSFDETYKCSFSYGGKVYLSYINTEDGTFIPIKKTASGIEYGKSVTGKENVVISEQFSYIDSDKAEEILIEKYDIKEGNFSWIMKMGEGKNAIYVYRTDEGEYYIDATNGTKMNSKDEIISAIAKDSGVSKNIIKNSKDENDEESVSEYIKETSYVDVKTNDVVCIYSFDDKGITYTYKIRNIDGKILDSKKDKAIGKDKAVEIAEQAIQKKYSPELQDDYEVFDWNRAYMRYLSSATTDETLKSPSEPEYVVSFIDESEENIYRVILKYDGSIVSEDNLSIEDLESNFFIAIYYVMGYDLDDFQDLEIGGDFTF